MQISTAVQAQLIRCLFAVDTEDMTQDALKTNDFQSNCLAVLNCYAVRDAASKLASDDYSGWMDRIQNVPGVESASLTSIHGFLIAQGLIRFEFTGRSVGLQYQLSTQGRESIARESVYLSDDPHRNDSYSHENGSAEQAA